MTKDQLRGYQRLKEEYKQIERQVRALEKHPATYRGPRAEQLLALYRERLERLAAEQLQIEEAIDTLGPTERLLLRCRYIEGLDWHQVCNRINYGWSQTHRLHNEALIQLQKL